MKTSCLHLLLRLKQRPASRRGAFDVRRGRAAFAMTLTALSLSAAVCAADKEQVVGDGGRILRYSSTQVRVELTPPKTPPIRTPAISTGAAPP